MNNNNNTFEIAPHRLPRVLFLGNGMLKLDQTNSISWEKLLQDISEKDIPLDCYKKVPYAMRPEISCGVDVEEVQKKVADRVTESHPHPLLKELLDLPFDAILTPNYTYEIEEVLSGKPWTDSRRKKAFTVLSGSHHAAYNTFICNVVETADGRRIPVFHIHGERGRKRSMVLSYYSYAKSLGKLVEYNDVILKNQPLEFQQANEPRKCRCWLDYFLSGDVYAVGFGFDLSEFDVWWAIERKARERAEHGRLTAYMNGKNESTPQKYMFEAMDVEYIFNDITERPFVPIYESTIQDIRERLE